MINLIFNTSEQDEAYEKFLAERKFWVYEKDLFSKIKISKYMLKKIEPEIMKLDNSYDLIRIVNDRLKKYHYGRIEMFLHLYNDSQKKGA